MTERKDGAIMSDPRPSRAAAGWPRRLPAGLLGMLALVWVVEGFVSHHREILLDDGNWSYVRNARAACRDARRYEVLCFGASLAKYAIVPQAIRERTGWSAYNLAVTGSQPPASYFLLRRALDSGARPKAVIVSFHTSLMRLDPRNNLGRWASLVDPVEAAQLAWWSRDPDLFAHAMLGRELPSFVMRGGLRDNIKGALAGTGDLRVHRNFLLFRNWGRNLGAELHPPDPALKALTEAQVDTWQKAYFPEWACHPANLIGVAKFLALAAEHDLPVYWILPPHLPGLHRRLAASGFDAEHEAFIRSWMDKYPNLTIIDGRRKLDDLDGFVDMHHLSAGASYRFSLAVGDVLRRTPREPGSDPRWVAIPEFHPMPLPEGVEDALHSRLAIKAREQERARRD